MSDAPEDPARLLEALRAAVLEGPGRLSPAERQAAAEGTPSRPALAAYVNRVRAEAHRMTDQDVESLRAADLDDDQIFELTIAAALGAALHCLERGLAAIDAAEEG